MLDAYALWQIDAGTRLRLSLANLVPIDSVGTVSVLQGSAAADGQHGRPHRPECDAAARE